ncbi:Gfo/Idh/MocA family oxidoreductase [Lachnospiraceae bacterium WCA-9-b2]|jgi:predicted dehydrogenase|uniref:Gfo/Idh/MocA family oxidoreductase n=1 Tax=Sporofaciens musculi TaxID=2681861 RepID=A0A7X3MGC4_9FIRM|nr:Gfo/Idh/MocA family oxidoreductase [Sporofaciens musculi]MCI8362980.1 Gfo/Idh/MocA family oxidoreductase [Clostridia bacterium]MXP75884.1 Gfo/Idh/MocA family oxidoreductase [Sporofaciens musculi]
METKLSSVIIGFGIMGRIRYHAMQRHGGYEIRAICDIRSEVREQMPDGLFVYSDWRTCIDEQEPKVVIVCAVNKMIPEIVCYALKRGCAVFSEKPPGRTLEDALKIQKVYNECGITLKFGFNHRYHNSVIEAKALLDSGLLGEAVCVRGVYGKAGNEHFAEEWRNNKEISGGGILLDQGIHMLDLMRYLLGSELYVKSGIVNNLVWKELETEDSAIALLETERHQIASIHSSVLQWRHKFDMDILCTNGYIALNGLLTNSKSYGEESITYYKKDLLAESGKLGRPKEHTMCFNEDFSWDKEMDEFYEAVTNQKPIVHGTMDDAVKTMQIVTDIYKLAEKKG